MFQITTYQELFAKVDGSGKFFAKKGSMVADVGQFKYTKRLLGTNEGSRMGRFLNHMARVVTGENLEIMEVDGAGTVYLADQGAHVVIVTLEPSGVWQSICVESENLLAFTPNCHYGVTPIGVGVLSEKGFFTSKLSYQGSPAQVAVTCNGNPLVLQAPCRVDPDALIAWTGQSPKVVTDVNWKTFIGQSSGESYSFEFQEQGQMVIVQPFERQSGLHLGMDDRRYRPDTQSNPLTNTLGGLFR